jgi:hypothetical protein
MKSNLAPLFTALLCCGVVGAVAPANANAITSDTLTFFNLIATRSVTITEGANDSDNPVVADLSTANTDTVLPLNRGGGVDRDGLHSKLLTKRRQ